jgi:hypothetical protein
MKLIDKKFETSRGEHKLYTVRSFGPNEGFGVLNRYSNVFLSARFGTRDLAWQYLSETDGGHETRLPS